MCSTGLERLDPVAVVERVDGQLLPVVRAELEDRDRLVHSAEVRAVLLEDLHHDARMSAVLEQRGARVVEVGVGVVAGPHLLDRQVEDLGLEALPLSFGDHPRARGTRRAPLRRPRAAPGSARPSRGGAGARGRASRAPSRADAPGSAPSTRRSPSRPRPLPATRAPRAANRNWRGARGGEDVADHERAEQRADEVRAAALVLLVARLAVLVGPDRDVLGAVVGSELGATQGDRSRSERGDRGDDLSRGRGQALRAAGDLGDRRAGDHRRQHAGPLERELHAGEPATRAREQRDRLRETGRPAKERVRDLGRAEALELGRDLEPSVGQADRASPRIRAVHEHAVRERHPAESDRFFGHVSERSG